jgi:hypothetical protein
MRIFGDVVSGYGSDFALFPELFTASLDGRLQPFIWGRSHRVNETWTHSETFPELAISYNINIITGSMPYRKRHVIQCWFSLKDGTSEMYLLKRSSTLQGNDRLTNWTFDYGLRENRLWFVMMLNFRTFRLMNEGMNICLFLSWRYQNAYTRSKHCAQARAIKTVLRSHCWLCSNLQRWITWIFNTHNPAVFTPLICFSK